MADSDFSVRAIISAQTSQFEKGMKDAQKSLGDVSKSIQNVSNLLKSAFSVAGIALSVKAITDFGSSCVKAADEANKSFSILNNTINVTGATARWNHAMDSLKESIGNQLMPAVNASTEQMTKIVTKITEFVNSSEFNKIVVVLANIANKVKEVFAVIGNYISEVFTEIMQIFNKVNFSPFKSVLDSLLGSVMKVVEIIKQRIDEGKESDRPMPGRDCPATDEDLRGFYG